MVDYVGESETTVLRPRSGGFLRLDVAKLEKCWVEYSGQLSDVVSVITSLIP